MTKFTLRKNEVQLKMLLERTWNRMADSNAL